jgi:hypothetical protein
MLDGGSQIPDRGSQILDGSGLLKLFFFGCFNIFEQMIVYELQKS